MDQFLVVRLVKQVDVEGGTKRTYILDLPYGAPWEEAIAVTQDFAKSAMELSDQAKAAAAAAQANNQAPIEASPDAPEGE